MIIQKITYGFVVQNYDTETEKFIDQSFVADDGETWEDEDCEEIEDPPDAYLNFEMIQP